MPRVLIAILAVIVLKIGITFLIGFYGKPGIQNLLYLSVAPFAVAFTAFSGWRGKLLGGAGLWPLFLPSAIAAELIAHVAGTCLQ
ncbi:hypothetical protein [Sphingomonas sp. MS122]|uniref:hypothetical protein n=1 Tax=Sphingomonas sp. MS122 TaxID=3412683 RepID=UPI003C2D22F4